MVRKFIVFVVAMGLLNIASVSGSAQTQDVIVYLGGGPIAGSISSAPGSTVSVPVLIIGSTGMIPSFRPEITVPEPLRTLATSTCTAETVQATSGAELVYRPCKIVGWNGPNGSQVISTEVESLSSMTGFRVHALLQIEIPHSTPVGSSYTLSAPSVEPNGFPTLSELTVNVAARTASSESVIPTPVREILPEEPLHDIDGSSLEFPIGSIKPFTFSIDYDAYPKATSASLTLYASTGIIDVADSSLIDWEASYACGSSGAATSRNMQKPRHSISALPAFFNLSLPRWMDSGTEIQVCAEVVYFNGTHVLGVERYMSVIIVRE